MKQFAKVSMSSILMSVVIIIGSMETDLLLAKGKTGQQIIEESQNILKIKGLEAVSQLVIVQKNGQKRVRKMAQVSKLYPSGQQNRLLKFLEPADVKGTGLLTMDYVDKGDDIHLYLPELKKVRRIVSAHKSASFMGSEFSYSDMNFLTITDFTIKLLGSEKLDKGPCHKVELTPKKELVEEYGYDKRIDWVTENKSILVKSQLFKAGKQIKELLVKTFKELDGKALLTNMEMKNLKNGNSSLWIVDKYELSPNVKESYFTTQHLSE